ncbi:MAG: c-type heme family protein [Thermodesulfobacteriota bacterium]
MKKTEQRDPQKTSAEKSFFQKSLGFRSQFLIGTALALLFFCLVSVLLIYKNEKAQLKEQAYAETQLVMAAVEASRQYVREELRPTMYEEFGSEFFLLQAMSTSYVSRAIMEHFNRVLPQYEYRRVAVNARNPESEANSLELSMIQRFRNNRDLDNWQGVLEVQGQKQFMRFKPVYFKESCMTCHGDPADAPQDLLDRYGAENGFGHQAGELAGVMAVGIPVQNALAAIRDQAATVFLALFAGALLFYLALTFIFNRVVTNNLHGVLETFRGEVEDKSLQDFLPEPDPQTPRDELQELTEAAVTMSGYLRQTKQELKDYAQNLEQKVARRTDALQQSENQLKQKVISRNQELTTLNRISELTTQACGLQDVWDSVLNQILGLISARGAGIYFLDESGEILELQYQKNASELPARIDVQNKPSEKDAQKWLQIYDSICRALSGELSTAPPDASTSCLNVPMTCRGRILGVMSFVSQDVDTMTREQKDLLLCIGQQVGIAVESLRGLQELVQNKELLQTVFDGITDQLVLLDRDLQIRMVNRAYLKRFNVEFADIENKPCFEVHAGLDDICQGCSLDKVLRLGTPATDEIETPAGEIFLIHFYPVWGNDGQVQNIIRYAREITEKKKVDQKIQQAEKLVALGQLSSGMAHEINNPLGIILCYVDLLKRQLTELPQGLDDLEVIEQQTINCKNIVTDLLQFSKKQESTKAPACMNRIIRDVAHMFQHQLGKKDIQLKVNLEPDMPEITVNRDKIRQVMVNLILNAMQAVREKGTIAINSCHFPDKKKVSITVWDNGPGVDSSIRYKIFDPFYSTKRTGEGTGLGLSVSYGIIQEHGGEINVESEKGKWTRFEVILPRDGE